MEVLSYQSDDVFLIDAKTGQRITYSEHHENVCHLVRWLSSQGYQQGDALGVMLENSVLYATFYFACLYGGFILVPVSPVWSMQQMKSVVLSSHVKAVIINQEYFLQYQHLFKEEAVICIRSEEVSNNDRKIEPGDQATWLKVVNPDNPAAIIYTSGSTAAPKGIVHPEAKIDPTAIIGPYVYIGRSEIDAGTVIEGHNYIYDQVVVGKNVQILVGCHLGAPGLGHIYNEKGEYENFPHIGRVIIGDDVEIRVHSSVAKGALADTIIGRGCKIDCQVQIGHNVVLEENVLVMANSMIGGNSRIKKNAVIAMSASIVDYVTVGENAHVGPGAVVVANVENNRKVFARPAMVMPADHRI